MIKEKDITFKDTKKIMKFNYSIDKITISNLLYKTIKIFHFEFIPSKYNKDKEVLVAQIAYSDGNKVNFKTLFTESFKIVNRFKQSDIDKDTYYYAKVVKSKDNYIYLAKPLNLDKQVLINLIDPYPI